jgi:hypothetical protein
MQKGFPKWIQKRFVTENFFLSIGGGGQTEVKKQCRSKCDSLYLFFFFFSSFFFSSFYIQDGIQH